MGAWAYEPVPTFVSVFCFQRRIVLYKQLQAMVCLPMAFTCLAERATPPPPPGTGGQPLLPLLGLSKGVHTSRAPVETQADADLAFGTCRESELWWADVSEFMQPGCM